MKLYRIIVIVIALISGISLTTICFLAPATQAAISEPVTEEYYDLLKENALNVAKTLDKNVITDKTLTADFYFSEEELVVTVMSTKAILTTKIPISNYSFNIENGTVIAMETANFEYIEYVQQNLLSPAWWYILNSIAAGVATVGIVYIAFYKAIIIN